MKRRNMKCCNIKFALAAAIGAVSLFAAPEDVFASIHAGMSAVISDCLSQSEGLVIVNSEIALTKAAALEADVETAEEPEAEEPEAEEPETEKEYEKFCGYTNLGLANVDNYLNVREKPDENSDLVGKMPAGAGCEVYGKEDGWYHIRSGKVEGYVSADYLLTGDDAKKKAEKYIKEVATVTTTTLFVRERPNTDCAVITMVPIEEELTVIKSVDDGTWYKIEIDDEKGFVSGDYVEISRKLPKAMTISEVKYGQGVSNVRVDLVQYALQFVGNPYVWGGTSLTRGVDCSGFTRYVMKHGAGVGLERSSTYQASQGVSVSAEQMQPGDLIFYGKGSKINHVAMYIGDGKVVHASTEKTGIKTSPWNYRTPLKIVNVLG